MQLGFFDAVIDVQIKNQTVCPEIETDFIPQIQNYFVQSKVRVSILVFSSRSRPNYCEELEEAKYNKSRISKDFVPSKDNAMTLK